VSRIFRRIPTLILLAAVASQAASARTEEPVRVAIVARPQTDPAAVGLARATVAQLCQIERVLAANVAVAQRLVPTAPDAPAEKLAEAGKLLRAQFVAVVSMTGEGRGEAEIVEVAAPSRRRLAMAGPPHELPSSLALALADAMSLAPTEAERQAMARPIVRSAAAVEAMWQGDAAREPEAQIRFYRAALSGDPDSALLRNQLGAALARAGQDARALEEFEAAARLQPDYAAAQTNRGLLLKQHKRWKEAEAAFRQAIALDAKSPTPHLGLARLLDRLGATIETVDELEKAVELDPSHVDALRSLADFYFETYDLKASRRTVERILEIEPQDVAALNLLGLLKLVPHDYKGAEETLRKALSLKPDAPETLANLGLALYGQKRTGEAIASIERAIALDARCAKAYLYLGRIHMTENRPDDAAAAFQRAAEIDPNMVGARQGIDSARAARAHGGTGCGCLDAVGTATGLADRGPGLILPAFVLLAPHALRLARRRKRGRHPF